MDCRLFARLSNYANHLYYSGKVKRLISESLDWLLLSMLLRNKLHTNMVCETCECSIILWVNCYSIEYFIINVIYEGYSTIRWSDIGGNIRHVLQHIVCCIIIMSQHWTCLCHMKQWEQLQWPFGLSIHHLWIRANLIVLHLKTSNKSLKKIYLNKNCGRVIFTFITRIVDVGTT